jgi:hypothetical protein
MNTRKYPRTLDEAFGSKDYCDPIERPHVYFDGQDRIVLWVCCLGSACAVAALVVFAAVEWLA